MARVYCSSPVKFVSRGIDNILSTGSGCMPCRGKAGRASYTGHYICISMSVEYYLS